MSEKGFSQFPYETVSLKAPDIDHFLKGSQFMFTFVVVCCCGFHGCFVLSFDWNAEELQDDFKILATDLSIIYTLFSKRPRSHYFKKMVFQLQGRPFSFLFNVLLR